MKKIIVFISLCLLIAIVIAYLIPNSNVFLLQWKYDLFHHNPYVKEKEEVDVILNTFETRAFKELEKHYLDYTKSNQRKYKRILSRSQYKVIRQEDFFKRIVGDFRIHDFICQDSFYRECLYDAEKEYYWLIDEKLLYAVQHLQSILRKEGYQPNEFWIRYGHRHPRKNEEVKGAGSSKHIKGQAIDMVIQDIDGSGTYTEADKAMIIDIIEKKVIGNKGGVGKYPGTRTVHIDVRGHRARWDSY